jgi:hypothetical protein
MAKKKGSETKEQKMIPITFKPQFSAASHKTVNLKIAEQKLVNGEIVTEYKPKIEGLPLELTIHKDEIYEVTPEQFKALYEIPGVIDTPEDIAERDRQRTLIGNQVGTNPKQFVVAKARTHLYQDGFVLADPESISLTRVKE